MGILRTGPSASFTHYKPGRPNKTSLPRPKQPARRAHASAWHTSQGGRIQKKQHTKINKSFVMRMSINCHLGKEWENRDLCDGWRKQVLCSKRGPRLSNSGRSVGVYGRHGETNQVVIIDLSKWRVVRTLQVPSSPLEILIRPDGQVAYVSCDRSGKVAALQVIECEPDCGGSQRD